MPRHGYAPDDPRARLAVLTTRERQCIDLRCDGLTTFGASTALGINYNTVKNHVASAFEKVKVSSIAEMCYLAGRCAEIDRFEIADRRAKMKG